MGPIFRFFSWNFPIFRRKWISGGDLGQHVLQKSSSISWIKSGTISCASNTSFDKINYSVVKSERSSLRAPTHPWCTVHMLRPAMCGGRRPGFCRKYIWRLVCGKQRELSIVSQRENILYEDQRTTRAISHALEHGSIRTLRRCHLHSCGLVRNEKGWSWVFSISR